MSLAGPGSSDGDCGLRNEDALHRAICHATRRGLLIVAAAGNAASDLAQFVPAAYPEVLAVTAMADSDGAGGALGPAPACRRAEADDFAASFSNFALSPLPDDERMHRLPTAPVQSGQFSWDGRSSEHSPLLQEQRADSTLGIRGRLLSAPGTCIESIIRGGQRGVLSGTSQACPHVSGVVALAYGTEGEPGPCSLLPPLQCMQLVVRRAMERQRTAQMAWEFFPFSKQDAKMAERAADGSSAGEVEVQLRGVQWSVSSSSSSSDNASLAEKAEDNTAHASGARFKPAAMSPVQGTVRMRKYYGPLVTALLG